MTRVQFYHSKEWRRLSRAFLLSKSYICERCGQPASIAHHTKYSTAQNVYDPNITLNDALLESLCLDCHNAEHFGNGGAIVQGLEFTPTGDIGREKL
jgi:5-methylcytosine-specific restriction endonuclease McrA